MNRASVVASLPLTSPLITPSTGEAEPRGSSCVLYDTYNTFCTIHIRNIGRYEWASVVCRKAQVVQSLCPYIHGVSSLVDDLGSDLREGNFPFETWGSLAGPWYFVIEGGELQDPLHSHPFSTLPCCPNKDLDHTIKPRHWSRPFTPHFRPS